MNDDAPNGLVMPPEQRVCAIKLSKWPLYAVLCGAILLLSILVYSVNFAHNPEGDGPESKAVEITEQKPLLMGEGQGLALVPPAGAALVQPVNSVPGPAENEPLIIVQKAQETSEQYRQELETIRRMKAQARLEALSAPLGVVKAASGAAGGPGPKDTSGAGLSASSDSSGGDRIPPSENYNPAAAQDREAFFTRASTDSSWLSPHERTPGQRYELKTGTVLPAALVTGINSDLPGVITAQVTRNVYDTALGRHLLIPQGAKLFGVYDSRVVFGQSRVLVAWNRVIFPDGSALTLDAMPGADVSGYAGYSDKVDNHYLRIFGSAFLMSLISGGMAYAVDSLDTSHEDDDNPSIQQEMGTALAAQLGQASLRLLEKNIAIAPTLEIRPGFAFNIVITKDIAFQQPYNAWR